MLFYGGLSFAVYNLATAIIGSPDDFTETYEYRPKSKPTLAIIGGAMMIASFPVKGGYTKKVKAALEDYNKTVVYQPTFNPQLNVIATSDGLGVAIRF